MSNPTVGVGDRSTATLAPAPDVTQHLLAWGAGDRQALDRLLPAVYRELYQLARRSMRRERVGHTLQTTALIHEAYLRLVRQQRVQWQDRSHFFAVAATMMRRVLLHHAERKHAAKRGGRQPAVTLDDEVLGSSPSIDLFALDEAIRQLEQQDLRAGRVVELKFFAGLTH
ncbi:MAG: ECF-type sigma factor, partial [Acidobacteriota bacterium]